MWNDKIIAILGLIGVSMFAIYQGGAESYELIKIIVSAIAGFVTGTVYVTSKKTDEKLNSPPKETDKKEEE